MSNFTEQTKNTASYANQSIPQALTWDQAGFTWDQADTATWDNPQVFVPQPKNTTSFVNQSEN